MRTSVANPIGPSFLSQAADAERLGRVELRERSQSLPGFREQPVLFAKLAPVEVKPVDSAKDDK